MRYAIKLKPDHEFVLDELSIAILQHYRKTIHEIAKLAKCSSNKVAKKLDSLLFMFDQAGIDSKFPVIAEKVMPQILEQQKQVAKKRAA